MSGLCCACAPLYTCILHMHIYIYIYMDLWKCTCKCKCHTFGADCRLFARGGAADVDLLECGVVGARGRGVDRRW